MFKHRLVMVASAITLASFALSPLAFARENQPGDDRGRNAVQIVDDRGVDVQVGPATADDKGVDLQPHARKGADDPAGDDRGVDPKPHARHGADDPAGDDRGVDPKPHA